ncbi:MAG TPA: MFS transporter [Candidatus Binataceae bacterium]|nr:MFS transporter [Candidatus Binataceae bacterium]
MALPSFARTGWFIIVGCFVVTLLAVGPAIAVVGVFFLPLIKAFGWSHGQVARIAAANMLATGLLSPVAGWLVDRIGARRVMSIGLVVFGTGYIGAARTHSLWPMVAMWGLAGAGGAATGRVPIMVLMVEWFKERAGSAAGIAGAGVSFGMMLAPPLVTMLIARAGWRAATLALAIPILLIALPVVLLTVRSRPPSVDEPRLAQQPIELPGLELGPAIHTGAFWLVLLAECLFMCANLAVVVNLIIYVVELGYSPQAAAWMFSLLTLIGAPGTIVVGWLIDRWTSRRMLMGTCFLLAFGIISLMLAQSPYIHGWGVTGCVMVWGTAAGSFGTFLPLLIADTLGLRRLGTLSGLVLFIATFGTAMGPVMAGHIYDRTGSYAPAFGVALVLCLAAALMLWLVRPAEGRDVVPRPEAVAAATEV